MNWNEVKIIADENIGSSLTNYLKSQNINITPFLEKFTFGTTDEEIIDTSNKLQSLVLKQDSDFSDLIFTNKYLNTGIIFLRLGSGNSVLHISTLQRILTLKVPRKPYIISARNNAKEIFIRIREL